MSDKARIAARNAALVAAEYLHRNDPGIAQLVSKQEIAKKEMQRLSDLYNQLQRDVSETTFTLHKLLIQFLPKELRDE